MNSESDHHHRHRTSHVRVVVVVRRLVSRLSCHMFTQSLKCQSDVVPSHYRRGMLDSVQALREMLAASRGRFRRRRRRNFKVRSNPPDDLSPVSRREPHAAARHVARHHSGHLALVARCSRGPACTARTANCKRWQGLGYHRALKPIHPRADILHVAGYLYKISSVISRPTVLAILLAENFFTRLERFKICPHITRGVPFFNLFPRYAT